MGEFEGSATQLVADVDCTAGGKDLCDQNGVRGYPTLKWGSPDDLQDYQVRIHNDSLNFFYFIVIVVCISLISYQYNSTIQGGRTFDDLKKFAEENLKPMCSVKNIDLCDDAKKADIKKYQDMSSEDLDAAIAAEEKKLEDAEAEFKAEVQKLQDKYTSLSQEKDAKIAEVKASGLGLMKSVKTAAAKAGSDEL